MATKGQKFKHYPEELKQKVVRERLEKGTSFLELAYLYGISSQESIMQWVKAYQKKGPDSFVDKRGTATGETAKLKGRPKKFFNDEKEKKEYDSLVLQRNKERAAENRRLSRVRKKRAERRALEESEYIYH